MQCEVVFCYAGYSSYTIKGHSPGELSGKLTEKYKVLADYLTGNKLKVNDDKTPLIVMTTRQDRRCVDTRTVNIVTPTSTITPEAIRCSDPPGYEMSGAYTRW